MTNPSRLDEIAARAEAATQGPWIVRHDHFDAGPGPDDEAQDWYIVEGADAVEHWAHYHEATTEFIAHAREDVPRLVSALRTVENLATHWATLAPGDQYYARMVRAAIREALS